LVGSDSVLWASVPVSEPAPGTLVVRIAADPPNVSASTIRRDGFSGRLALGGGNLWLVLPPSAGDSAQLVPLDPISLKQRRASASIAWPSPDGPSVGATKDYLYVVGTHESDRYDLRRRMLLRWRVEGGVLALSATGMAWVVNGDDLIRLA
jgi:hypothetical protein